jgi:outer membrane protein
MKRILLFKYLRLLCYLIFLSDINILEAQNHVNVLSDSASIEDCIKFALQFQPLVKQLKLDEAIADQNIHISLSDWLPQITSSAGYQYFLKQPVSFFPNLSDLSGPKVQVPIGLRYNSNIQITGTQNIFTSDLYFAGRSARYYRQQVGQTTQKGIIQLVADISKAFYDLLLSEQMLGVIDEAIARLSEALKNTQALYNNGATDKIDYSRAIISLNNAKSQKISILNTIKVKNSYLKQLMGYPDDKPLALKYNFDAMKENILIDTLQSLNYKNRIEYQLLETNIQLQKLSVSYSRWNFLPSLSGYATYNMIYQNDVQSQLYKQSFPNSNIGLALSFPLFSGTKKWQNIRKSKFTYERMVQDTLNLKNEMTTGYVQAMSAYKSNLSAYKSTKENMAIARDVYNTVMYQYKQGVKPYIDVIISETDLFTMQLNNLSSLIMLMYSKIDLQQALGKLPIAY